MAIRTSKATGTVNHGGQSNAIKSGRVFSDIIFKPGDTFESKVVAVDQYPIHIFAAIPRGYYMDTTRVYGGPSVDCIDIPDTKVPCLSGVIHNVSDEDMDLDMWIVQRGSYRFSLVSFAVTPQDVVPEDIYVWYMFDDMAPCDECCDSGVAGEQGEQGDPGPIGPQGTPGQSGTSGGANILVNSRLSQVAVSLKPWVINQDKFVFGEMTIGQQMWDEWRYYRIGDLQRDIMRQLVEIPNVLTGTHTLSWEGGGVAEVRSTFASLASGISPLPIEISDLTVPYLEVDVPIGSYDILMSPGADLPIQHPVNIQQEFAKCQRHYQVILPDSVASTYPTADGSLNREITFVYNTNMMFAPDPIIYKLIHTGWKSLEFHLDIGELVIKGTVASPTSVGTISNIHLTAYPDEAPPPEQMPDKDAPIKIVRVL